LNRSLRHTLYTKKEIIAETRLPVIANGDITALIFP